MPRSLALLIALFSLACAGDLDPRLKPLTVATLEPGVGLGDVRLGETSLGAFVDRLGHDRIDLIAGDEIGYELVFADGEMAFLFVLGEQHRGVELETLREGQRDLTKTLSAHPELREMRLASLTVGALPGRTEGVYVGRLAAPPVGLFGRMKDALLQLGLPSDLPEPMLAGASPRRPESELRYPERGIVLEGSGTLTEDDCFITRMTIFEPQEP